MDKNSTLPLPSSYDIPLHDIKPLMEVNDTSFYMFLLLILAVLLVLAYIAYKIYAYIEQKRAFNIRKEHLKALKELKFDSSKKSAYEFTKYAYTFSKDSHRMAEAYKNLLKALEESKYKKDAKKISDSTMGSMQNYIEMIDV